MVKKTYFISHQSYLDTVNSDESYTYLRGVYVISVAAKMARMHPQTLALQTGRLRVLLHPRHRSCV